MKFKVGDKVRVLDGENISDYTQGWGMDEYVGDVVTIQECILYPDNRTGYLVKENPYVYDERGLKPVDVVSIHDLPNTADVIWSTSDFCAGFKGGKIPTPEKPVSIEEQLGLPKGVNIYDLDTSALSCMGRSAGKSQWVKHTAPGTLRTKIRTNSIPFN